MLQTKPQPSRTAVASSATAQAVAFETELGWTAVVVANDQLESIVFGRASFAELLGELRQQDLDLVDDASQLGPWVVDLCDRLQRYTAGEPCEFLDIPVATQHLTPFAQDIVQACRQLAWGKTATYAQLAATAGRPAAARAVGNVMANNRCPLVVPCHRVVGSGGHLGGYSAPGGLKTKQHLLDMESSGGE